MSLLQDEFHSYIPLEKFLAHNQNFTGKDAASLFCATGTISKSTEERPWLEVQKVIDKVHKHVCGHSNYTDIKLLLQRNGIWSDDAQKYLAQVLEVCENCHATHSPKQARKVSLSTISPQFNEVVCVDHFFWMNTVYFI